MSDMKVLNFQKWIDEHRHLLKPPVGNKLVFPDSAPSVRPWNACSNATMRRRGVPSVCQ